MQSSSPVETIGDVERLNSGAGQHFFDADTLRFFASRVHEPIIAHRFFVTTEKSGFEDPTRRSTVRMVRDSGTVETVGEFGQFGAPAKARKALQDARKPLDGTDRGTLASGGVSVRFDPYDSDWDYLPKAVAEGLTERGLFKRFCWRAYVGGLPIGSRTTRADARQLAREAASPCHCR